MTASNQSGEMSNVLYPTRVARVVSYSLLFLLHALLLALDSYARPTVIDWLRHHDSSDPSGAPFRHAIVLACGLATPPVLALAAAVYPLLMAVRAFKTKHFPLRGYLVLSVTPVLNGRAAMRKAVSLAVFGLLPLVLTLGILLAVLVIFPDAWRMLEPLYG
jgi:hypothetical protein